MAIEWVKEVPVGRNADAEAERGIRRYFRAWLIRMTTATEGPLAATDTSALPKMYTHYLSVLGSVQEEDTGATLRHFRARQRSDDLHLWDAEGEYSNEITAVRTDPMTGFSTGSGGGGGTSQGADEETDPLQRQPDIDWESSHLEYTAVRDLDGNAMVYPNGEKFDQQVEESVSVCTITRNEANYDATIAHEYRNSVNESTFAGFAAETCKMDRIKGTRLYERDYGNYWKVTYVLMFAKLIDLPGGTTWSPWQSLTLNQGSFYLDGGEKKAFTDANGATLSTGLLAADGTKLAVGGTPTYTQRRIRARKNFTTLGLPI